MERQALLCGYIIERMVHDYGIDLELFTFNRKGEIEEGKILIQVKASDRLRLCRDPAAISFRITRSDLVFWLAEPMPVILIVYDAKANKAHWLYVQSHFRSRSGFNLFAAGRSLSVEIPLTNVVDRAAMRKFARFRDRIISQMREVTHDEDENDSVQ